MDADGGLGFADWVAGQRLSRQPCKRQRRAGGQGFGVPGSAAEAVACLRRDAGQPRWGAQCAWQRISGAGWSFGSCKRQRRTDGQALGFAGFLPLPFLPVALPRGALERCAEQHGSGPDFSCGPCGRQRRTGRRGLGVAGLVAGQGVLASPCNRQRRTSGQALGFAGGSVERAVKAWALPCCGWLLMPFWGHLLCALLLVLLMRRVTVHVRVSILHGFRNPQTRAGAFCAGP
jgi:hypothetical protein